MYTLKRSYLLCTQFQTGESQLAKVIRSNGKTLCPPWSNCIHALIKSLVTNSVS
jgi:hypothetical protein